MSSLKVFHSDSYDLPLPEGHRFPMNKYRMLREALVKNKILKLENLYEAPLAEKEDILRVHTSEYYHHIENGTLDPKKQKLIGFPWSEIMIKRSRASVGGFLAAIDAAMEFGISGNLSGGTHHSFKDYGEGFCVFNDFAIGALKAIHKYGFHDILLLDLDVHQGNGNAILLRDIPEVFVVSMHGESNYPFRKPPSDIDIGLPDGTEDFEYNSKLNLLLEKLSLRKWDLILYQAGVDPLKEDTLGKLNLTLGGLQERDRLVLSFAKKSKIPIAIGLGGGYSRPIELTLEAHLNTYRTINSLYL